MIRFLMIARVFRVLTERGRPLFFYFRSISSLFDSSDNVSNRRRRNLKASSDLSTSEASLEQEFNGRTMRRTFHSSAIWRINFLLSG
uniref:Uncharacterized protein n=1 Tax=Caenorhabditis japonica TaxID=281687 RepID=A0A8R1EPL4_CAEJA